MNHGFSESPFHSLFLLAALHLLATPHMVQAWKSVLITHAACVVWVMYLYWYLPIISNLFETFCICPQEPKTTLISLIYRISDTGSQGCTDLQSLVTCLDHGDIVAQYAVMKGCVRCAMRWSASRRLYLQSWTVATLTWKLLSNICSVCCWILGQGWQLTAGHKHKHNACRAEIGGCVSGYTYISRVKQLWFF